MSVPNVFANATTSIPLVQLDQNFNTGITLGNTTVYLGNTTTSFGNVTLTGADVNGTVTLTTPLAVTSGGTGRTTGTTAYGLIAAGTTATGAQQTLSAGATTEILVGGGTSALPAWTTATGTGAPVRQDGATLTTPTIGAALGTSLTMPSTATRSGAGTNDICLGNTYGLRIANSTNAAARNVASVNGSNHLTIGEGGLNDVYIVAGGVVRLQGPSSVGTILCAQMGYGGPTYFYEGDASGYSANDACMKTHKVAGTGRSINAAGTINASGADYAEYERIGAIAGPVAKGQIIGFDSDGRVTDRWANAISFGVKSTDPAYVGGDAWGAEQAICVDGAALGPEPKHPEPRANPVAVPPKPVEPGDVMDAYNDAKATFDVEQVVIEAEHKKAVAAYQEELANFKARLEAQRQTVDRIAYSGKVPVNVTGAKPGDYIVPMQDGEGIAGIAVASPTFDQYRIAVGQVRKILPDGRAQISVKVC